MTIHPDLAGTELTTENLLAADCVVVTNHSAYDYDFIIAHARLIVDTRNIFDGKEAGNKLFMAYGN